MKRSDFLRNVAGAIAAVVVGSKLGPLVSTAEDVPGIGTQAFKLYVPRGFLRPYDIIQTAGAGQFIVRRTDEKLIAQNLHNDMIIELTETDLPHEQQVAKLYSVLPEDHAYTSPAST